MKGAHKFLNLSLRDKQLLVGSAFLLWTIRLGLWLLPFQLLRRLLARMTQTTSELQEPDEAFVNRVIWAVKKTSRYVPAATCLTQALAAQVLLARRGQSSHLRIGVLRSEEGQLEAHAWVESQGRIVIGGLKNLSRFTPLPPLETDRL